MIKTKWLLGLLLCLLAICPACAENGVDRVAAYRAALPLYADTPAAPLHVRITDRKTFPGSRMMRLSYVGANGLRVPALLFLPPMASAKRPVPCLIVLHGLGGNKELMSGFCRFLASAGYASLAIDIFGQGERAAPTQGKTVSADDLQQNLIEGVKQTARDVRRGLDYLQSRHDIDPHRMGLGGFSLGAIIGTVAAGTDPRLKATVLVSGGGGWGEILHSLSARVSVYNGRRVTGSQDLDWNLLNALLAPEDPLTFAPHIAPRALLMINGRQDTTIPPARAQALYEAAHSGPDAHVQIDWLPQAGHLPPIETLFPTIRQWLQRSL